MLLSPTDAPGTKINNYQATFEITRAQIETRKAEIENIRSEIRTTLAKFTMVRAILEAKQVQQENEKSIVQRNLSEGFTKLKLVLDSDSLVCIASTKAKGLRCENTIKASVGERQTARKFLRGLVESTGQEPAQWLLQLALLITSLLCRASHRKGFEKKRKMWLMVFAGSAQDDKLSAQAGVVSQADSLQRKEKENIPSYYIGNMVKPMNDQQCSHSKIMADNKVWQEIPVDHEWTLNNPDIAKLRDLVPYRTTKSSKLNTKQRSRQKSPRASGHVILYTVPFTSTGFEETSVC